MSRDISQKEVQELLAQGYDPKLIAFEFQLDINDIKILSNKPANKPQNRQKKAGEQETLSEEQLAKIVQKMRENYRDVFTPKQVVKAPKKPMSPKQKEIVEDVIEKIDKIISDVDSGKHVEPPRLFAQTTRFKDYNLELDQILKIYNLLCTRQIKSIIKYEDSLYTINAIRSGLITKCLHTVNAELEQVETIEELGRIERMIPKEFKDANGFTYTAIKSKIEIKRAEINRRQIQESKENNGQETIHQIASNILEGKFDSGDINERIDLEVKRLMEAKNNSPFALNEEQRRKQFKYQLKQRILERENEFNVSDTNAMLQGMQGVFGSSAVTLVVEILIKKGEFEKARKMCDSLLANTKEYSFFSQISSLKNRIRNAEISNRVIEQMEKTGATKEEDANFIKWLLARLKTEGIKPNDVTIGDGQKSLALLLNRKVVEKVMD